MVDPLFIFLLVSSATAASMSGKKLCSGDWLKGFVEDGEEGCCLADGLCNNPRLNMKWAREINRLASLTSPKRHKRSIDFGGFLMRKHLDQSNKGKPEAQSSQLLTEMKEFQESPVSNSHTCPAGCYSAAIDICPTILKLSFPLFGTSVTRKQRVHIIQAGSWFDQPVIRRMCTQTSASFIRGTCRQIVQPQLMFVVPEGVGAAGFGLDYVYVESGCECTMNLAASSNVTQTTERSTESADLIDWSPRTSTIRSTSTTTPPPSTTSTTGPPTTKPTPSGTTSSIQRPNETTVEELENMNINWDQNEELKMTEEDIYPPEDEDDYGDYDDFEEEEEKDPFEKIRDNESPFATTEPEHLSENEPDYEASQINGANSPSTWYPKFSTP